VAAASLDAPRGIGGDACTKTGADMGGRRYEYSGALRSLLATVFDVLEAASLLAAQWLSFGGVLESVVLAGIICVHRPDFLPEKVQDSEIQFATPPPLTHFSRSHHVEVQI
jgi:hypothetical protein